MTCSTRTLRCPSYLGRSRNLMYGSASRGAAAVSRRPAVLRRLHAIDARRLHQTRSWVVSFPILSCFGQRRGRRGVSERTRSRRWRRGGGVAATHTPTTIPTTHATKHRPLLHEHDAPLESRAALPPDRAQRRDQHDPGQRELDGLASFSCGCRHGRGSCRLLLRFSGSFLRVRRSRRVSC